MKNTDKNTNNQISDSKSPFKKAADNLVNSVIEKTENSNFQDTELENLLKIATAVAKTVPDLMSLAGQNDSGDENRNQFISNIRQFIISDKRASKSAAKLLQYIGPKVVKN